MFIFTFFLKMFFCIWSYKIQLIFKQVYLTHRGEPNRFSYTKADLGVKEWRGTPHSLEIQNWSLAYRKGSYPSAGDTVFQVLPTGHDIMVRVKKVKLVTLVKGNLKAPFSIATTLMYRRWHYSFSWIALLYPWYVPYNVEC